MTQPVLLADQCEGVLTLTLNRSDQRNAINPELREALLAQLDEAADAGARVILLRAEGPTFCAGADLGDSRPEPGVDTLRRMRVSTQRLVREILEHPLPVVAAVRGTCAGFGVSIALAADFCVMAEDAKFLPAFSRVGLAPDGAIALTMTRALGIVDARRFLLLGEPVSGAQAASERLVHAAVPDAEVDAAALDVAVALAGGANAAVSAGKRLLAQATGSQLDAVLVEERTHQAVLTATADHREGVRALLERRPPRFGSHSD